MVGNFKRIGHKPRRNKKLEWEIKENGCWEVTSHAKDKDGYARMRERYKTIGCHRYIYQECFGEIPDNMVVRHKCDNPSCINPEHLELGTIQDNNNDRTIRNRSAKGNKNGATKIKEEDIPKILRAREMDLSTTQIGYIFGVSHTQILKILNGEREYYGW